MTLSGLHLLLTYQCTFECDHCFVWGSPWNTSTMTLDTVRRILRQAADLGTIEWIYFEGGEPFLYYPVMRRGIEEASTAGFRVGIVSNAYWATSLEDALEWLRPFAGDVEELSVSCDSYHGNEETAARTRHAEAAAKELGISTGVICIAGPETAGASSSVGQIPEDESAVMYKGRAAEKLANRSIHYPCRRFTECPHEDLRNPERVHVDPYGNLHICQGISIGNMLRTPLAELCRAFDPDTHPVIGPLLQGGPLELALRYDVPHRERYADACHLCFEVRRELRERFPEVLTPDEMYGPEE
jgi:hypothetical protein